MMEMLRAYLPTGPVMFQRAIYAPLNEFVYQDSNGQICYALDPEDDDDDEMGDQDKLDLSSLN